MPHPAAEKTHLIEEYQASLRAWTEAVEAFGQSRNGGLAQNKTLLENLDEAAKRTDRAKMALAKAEKE